MSLREVRGRHHSQRSATIGSTFVARRAARKQASIATNESNKTTMTMFTGSVAVTPYNKLDSVRLRASAAIIPATEPMSTGFNPCAIHQDDQADGAKQDRQRCSRPADSLIFQ